MMLTPESMREWEDRLGPEKAQTACDLMRSHGWSPHDAIPMWVWAQAYRMVEGHQPMVWGNNSQRLDERLLGFKLF